MDLKWGWNGRISVNTSKIRGTGWKKKNLKNWSEVTPSYRYYPGTCPKEPKTKTFLSQKSWSTGLDQPGISIILTRPIDWNIRSRPSNMQCIKRRCSNEIESQTQDRDLQVDNVSLNLMTHLRLHEVQPNLTLKAIRRTGPCNSDIYPTVNKLRGNRQNGLNKKMSVQCRLYADW
jgi:hypothetical protein